MTTEKATSPIKVGMRMTVIFVCLLALGCESPGGVRVSATAVFLKGPKGGPEPPPPPPPAQAMVAQDTAYWDLTPDRARMTFTRLQFLKPDGGVLADAPLGECQVEYNQGANSGAELFACEFEAPVGEISGIIAYVRDEFEVLFDDSKFGFYTDVNGLVYGQPPAGGPSFYTFTTGEGGTQDLTFISVFPEPFAITESEPLRIAIVVDMIHTMKGQVVNAEASFRDLARPAFIQVSPTGTGRSVFYNQTGATLNYPDYFDFGQPTVRLLYGDNAVEMPLYLEAQGPGTCAEGSGASWAGGEGSIVGGYLGRDAQGYLAWAYSDDNWVTHAGFAVMLEAAPVGSTTLLRCLRTEDVPAPLSGTTYASGAPEVPNVAATEAVLLFLAAQ